ncbi:MAG: hypothetical protein K8R90_00255 [Candidatus Cloacimonetes bacterium]|nr:hypothetical protein [Candidatus Cloacimonadota bacterium]
MINTTRFTLLLCLLAAPILLTAQAPDTTSTEGFSMGGGFGTIMMGDNTYTQIRLMPELVFGKIGIGLDVDILIDEQGNVREEDWDEFEDYLAKIYYIRYARRGDPFFARIGGFPGYTLGHGLVMQNYSNMLRYPEHRQIGLQLGGNIPVSGLQVEAYTSNLVENDILAGRASFQPLQAMELPLLSSLRLGGTYATDLNQYNGLLDSDNDNYPDYFDDYPYDDNWHDEVDYEIDERREAYKDITGSYDGFEDWFANSTFIDSLRNKDFDDFGESEVSVMGIDYELPLIMTDHFTLTHYGEAAQIVDHNMGFIWPGFGMRFLIFQVTLEHRYYQEDFEPAFFDNLYEENRARVVGDSVIVKSETLPYNQQMQGWYGSVTAHLFHTLFLKIAYEDMYGDDVENGKSLWAGVWLDQSFIPRLTTARVDYSQTRVDNVFTDFKTPSTLITGRAGFSVGGSAELVAKYQERYIDLDGNGEINGNDETIKTMAFGVEFRF